MPPVDAAPLRIEIIDPIAEPGWAVSGAERVVAIATEPGPGGADRLEPLLRRLEPVGHRVELAVDRAAAVQLRLVHRRLQRVHDGNPRRDSRVRQHLLAPFDEVGARLPPPGTTVRTRSGRLELTSAFARAKGGTLRAEASLRLPGSWPALPLVVTVEPWWRRRTVITVALRTQRRWRYPRRYFGAAHAATRRLGELVGT